MGSFYVYISLQANVGERETSWPGKDASQESQEKSKPSGPKRGPELHIFFGRA
jgi:hypothetical protein